MEQTNPLPSPVVPPQMPVNPPVNQPVNPPSSNKPILIVLLVILLVILSSLTTYFIVKSQSKPQTPVSSPSTIQPSFTQPSTVIPSPSSPVDPTAGWKTYNNAGISFKYPPNWVYEKYDIPGRAELHGLVQLMPKNYKPDMPMMPLFIEYWDNPEGLTIEQYDKKINQGAAILYPLYSSQAQVITLGGLTTRYEQKGDCSPFNCHKYVISAQNKIWEISSQYANDPNEFKSIINQILSTFKFN